MTHKLIDAFQVETIAIAALRPHPRNYKVHPQDQIEHLAESIRAHGLYRNIVVARDNTILAGHGVVQAAQSLGMTDVPVVRLDLDAASPRALKVLAGDNEVMHLGERDDRALSELLKQIKDEDLTGLLGTGYDEAMLATLVMITRPASEIADMDEAAEWAGMPEYAPEPDPLSITLKFRTEDARTECAHLLNLPVRDAIKQYWWPAEARADVRSVHIDG